MKNLLKRALLNNVQIKLFSIFFGYVCWSIVNQSHTDDMWIDVPVCFDQAIENLHIQSPETVKINLSGRRSDLRAIDINSSAVHIDTRDLKDGKNIIALSERKVLLPETIQVIGWIPTHLKIEMTKKQNNLSYQQL